jgi:hypothetical protein
MSVKTVRKNKKKFNLIFSRFVGKFCHELLKKTAKWGTDKSLVDVVKAVVEHIDKPDIDYSLSLGLFFSFFFRCIIYYP